MDIEQFMRQRLEQNEIVHQFGGKEIKRFFSLDGQTYREGALSVRTKELLGLVASTVLRCDDCIRYHTVQCHEAGISDDEYQEAMSVALIVGGSIVIPHLRRAFATWKELREGERA